VLISLQLAALDSGEPVLWYANRACGFVLLALLTLTTTAGVLAGALPGTRDWPRAATQSLHRNLGLLSVLFLVVHIASAVIDEFVDIRWWQALVPFTSPYERGWLGIGVVALDLILAVALTSLARPRINHQVWQRIHWFSYAAWLLGMIHGIGMGTDASSRWGLGISIGCAVMVAVAVGVRLVTARSAPPRAGAPTAEPVQVGRRVSR